MMESINFDKAGSKVVLKPVRRPFEFIITVITTTTIIIIGYLEPVQCFYSINVFFPSTKSS